MTRLKRQRWWLISVTALICVLPICNGLKTFSKSSATSTTTTTTTTEAAEEETTVAVPSSTKPPLTGIPQIDYIWDPNLPRELNGYNLTDYPFLGTTPPSEQISFKCDGLHDGFYASVAYKCQLYHHCLYGTRYDFLCANFTAFDQKTFICHFASEVDCANSHKYWNRNDALYKATTTTSTTTTTVAPPPTRAAPPPPPRVNRRRPLRRRRPQYDYYYDEADYADSDYYEEQPRDIGRRRKRPLQPHTPARNPQQYDDYDDDRYDHRRDYDEYTGSRAKPYDRPRGNNAQRRRPLARQPPVRKQPPQPQHEPSVQPSSKSKSSVYDRPRAPPKIRRPVPLNQRDKYDYKPNTPDSPPSQSDLYYDDYEDEEEPVIRPSVVTRAKPEPQPQPKPQPKLQPKPQPQTPAPAYERPLVKQQRNEDRAAPLSVSKPLRRPAKTQLPRRPVPEVDDDQYDYEYKPIQREQTARETIEPKEARPRYESRRTSITTTTTQPPPLADDEYYEDEDYDVVEPQPRRETESSVATGSRRGVVTTTPKPARPLLRVVKRPFLPSRGGSPYLPRGLQPIGRKAKPEVPAPPADDPSEAEQTTAYYEKTQEQKNKQDHHRRKPVENNYQQTSGDYLSETLKPVQKPIVERTHIRQEFGDFNENEYDVTLNDALNPTLPNLTPLRNTPSGFVIPKSQHSAYSSNGQSYRGRTYYPEASASDVRLLRSPIDRSAYQ